VAKRRLKRPCLPPGDRVSFFAYMQELVLENRDLPLVELGKLVHRSHQSVYKALTGPKLPSLELTTDLAQKLGGVPARDEAARRWRLAVREEREVAASQEPVVRERAAVEVAAAREDASRQEGRETFAAALDAFVRANGGVQSVAAHTGVGASTLYAWVSGKSAPRSERFSDFLKAIAERHNGFDMSGEGRLQAAYLELSEKDRAKDRADAQHWRAHKLMEEIREMDTRFGNEGVYE